LPRSRGEKARLERAGRRVVGNASEIEK